MSGNVGEIVLSALEPMQALARRLVDSPEEAEDIIQETCIRALRNAATLEAHPLPHAYLFRVLRNLSLDRHRSNSAAPPMVSMEILRTPDGEIPQLHTGTSGVPAIVRNSLNEDVQAALDALPGQYRAAFWLREIDGMTYEEIAEVLGVPAGTVRSRLSRARERMVAALPHRSGNTTNRKRKSNS